MNERPSTLSVKRGLEEVPSINPRFRRAAGPVLSLDELVDGLLAGNRSALSRAITLIESTRDDHRDLAGQLLERVLPRAGNSRRIGITGVPGVGKSTLIDLLGLHVLENEGERLAVLAVDPSSSIGSGSILGDKNRMPRLAVQERAFIRPSPAGTALGGVAHQTRETISLCEAAGFTTIFVETVGVGQSEHAVSAMVDCFVLLTLAGSGDELQGIKRGVMELADVVAVTKADGANVMAAELAQHQLEKALRLFSHARAQTPVLLTSAIEAGTGVTELWSTVRDFILAAQRDGSHSQRRQDQAVLWMRDLLRALMLSRYHLEPERLAELESKVRRLELTPRAAAESALK